MDWEKMLGIVLAIILILISEVYPSIGQIIEELVKIWPLVKTITLNSRGTNEEE